MNQTRGGRRSKSELLRSGKLVQLLYLLYFSTLYLLTFEVRSYCCLAIVNKRFSVLFLGYFLILVVACGALWRGGWTMKRHPRTAKTPGNCKQQSENDEE